MTLSGFFFLKALHSNFKTMLHFSKSKSFFVRNFFYKIFFCFIFFLSSYQSHLISSESFSKFGDVTQVAIPCTGAAMTAYWKDSEGFWQLAKVMASNQVTVEILKRGIAEKRPNGGKHSFPSGHTAAAFAGAGFIHRRYGLNYGAAAYGLASLVGASRVDNKAHWVHDVVSGASIGVLFNYVFTSPFETKVSLSPWILHKQKGLAVNYSF